MSAIDLADTHFILESATDVQAICQPFMALFDLTYFDYCKIYHDGRMSILASNPYWVKHFFAENYPAGGEVRKDGLYLWPSHLPTDAISNARQYFNQDHGMTTIREHNDHIEFFDFATKRDNHRALYYYLNHYDIFEKFTTHFKQTAKSMITAADQHCLSLAPLSEATPLDDSLLMRANELLSSTPSGIKPLTQRQLICLKLLAQGMNMREIGEHLNLSRRTVEHYIGTIKKKLNCDNRMELIAALKKLA